MQLMSVLVVIAAIVLITTAQNITIHNHFGIDKPACLNNINNTYCKTLEYVAEKIASEQMDETISIKILYVVLNRTVNFSSINDLVLTGGSYACADSDKGLIFHNVTNLTISNTKFTRCSAKINDHSIALRFENCINVHIVDVTFMSVRETAMAFENTVGCVSLKRVRVLRNALYAPDNQKYSFSGGVEVMLNTSEDSTYSFHDCLFSGNRAPGNYINHISTLTSSSDWRGQGLGGAISIYIRGTSSNNHVEIRNCTFSNNLAIWGGGLLILLQDRANYNTISIVDSMFESNRAVSAGAGTCIKHFLQENSEEDRNKISYQNCTFHDNHGDVGGGVAFYSVHSRSPSTYNITFINSTWSNNEALFGSAVIMSPAIFDRLNNGHLPSPSFKNSTFTSNTVIRHLAFTHSGIFSATEAAVNFYGRTIFTNNQDSAIHILSGQIIFGSGSVAEFVDNTGIRGASIAMYGSSSMLVNVDSFFLFSSNYAEELGGGIYYETFDQEDYIYGRNCFLRHQNRMEIPSNFTFTFVNNTAGITGDSIYATTLFPCHFSVDSQISMGLNYSMFNHLGNVTLDTSQYPLATFGRHFIPLNSKGMVAIPGELINIGKTFDFLDEFYNPNPSISAYALSIDNKKITLDRKYTLVGDFRIFGAPGMHGTLILSQHQGRRISLLRNVSLLQCPPGFYHNESSDVCQCSTHGDQFYYGVSGCDDVNFHAQLIAGYWIGYIPSTNQVPEALYTSLCPLNFCNNNNNSIITLPRNATELSNRVCGMNRQGILCGQCTEGFSPFYHVENFECGSDELCQGGIIFYILSELIPVVILFTVVIILDISFTSGSINGFIFFSQVLESLSTDIRTHNEHAERFRVAVRLFYNVFNFDYFSTSSLSFCLWKNATVIDILAFKYVTVVFAFVMIIVLVLLMKYVKCSKLEKKLNLRARVSVINGMSAFLVICYSQCARTSFYILTPIKLRTQAGVIGDNVAFFGGIPFFQGRHLFYSIVAISFIITVITIPLIILLVYPLTLHLLALCNLSEHQLVEKLLRISQINRLKPLIDSFQGCYRDKVRFFSGLYFAYRVIILGCYSLARSTSQFHVISQFLLMGFMGIHSIVQPYKKRSHNIIDSFIFLTLVIINGCTVFINVYNVEFRENQFNGSRFIVTAVITLQLFFLCLPMCCFLIWMTFKVVTAYTSRKGPSLDTSISLECDEIRSDPSKDKMDSGLYGDTKGAIIENSYNLIYD